MKTRYSPSMGTSYPLDIDYGDSLPADVIEIEQSDYDAICAARSAGDEASYVDGKVVIVPRPPVVRTPEMIRAENVTTRDGLLSIATSAIAPLQDAVDLEEATADETAALLAWKKFRIAVNRVNLTIDGVTWPDFPPQHYAAQLESPV